MAGLIFPPLAEASIHEGVRYRDCAGSGVVHLVGGVAALAGNSLLGRRIMRVEGEMPDAETPEQADQPRETGEDKENSELLNKEARWQRRFDNAERDKAEFQPCNYLQVMGMFILWVGWYGFNTGGSLTAQKGSAHTAGLVAWNTTVAAAAGGFGSYLYLYGFRLNLDVGFLCNGLLSGLVSITACCDVSTPLASLCIGLVAGAVVYPLTSNGMRRWRLDDPVDAVSGRHWFRTGFDGMHVVPVHAASGFFGILVVAFCRPDCSALREIGLSEAQRSFCGEDHHIGKQLLAQLLGGAVIIVWTFLISYAFWLLLAAAECVKSLELEQVNRAENLLRQLKLGRIWTGNKHGKHATDARRDFLVFHASNLVPGINGAFVTHGSPSIEGARLDGHWLFDRTATRSGKSPDEVATSSIWLVGHGLRTRGLWPPSFLSALLPTLEISGLGAAETDGGKLYMALQSAAGQLAELRRQSRAEPLQSEDILLRRLISRRYSNLSSRRLRHIPEQASLRPASIEALQLASPASGACARTQELPGAGERAWLMDLGHLGLSSRAAWQDGAVSGAVLSTWPSNFRLELPSETASTVSDASLGALSPHSVASTPPPTMHGRARRLPSQGPGPGAPVMNVAEQLVQMLQMQQQLLSAIGALKEFITRHVSGAVGATSQAAPAALLYQALQQVADASPASSRRSSITA
eukprot:g5073.t1